MAHVLIIIVSVGFGVVKPRLGSTMNKVFAIGICYFLLCSVESLSRASKAFYFFNYKSLKKMIWRITFNFSAQLTQSNKNKLLKFR